MYYLNDMSSLFHLIVPHNLLEHRVMKISYDNEKIIVCGGVHNSSEWNNCIEIEIISQIILNIYIELEIRKQKSLLHLLEINE